MWVAILGGSPRLCLQNAKQLVAKWIISISLSISSTSSDLGPSPHKWLTGQFALTICFHIVEGKATKLEAQIQNASEYCLKESVWDSSSLPLKGELQNTTILFSYRGINLDGSETYKCWAHTLPLQLSLYPRLGPRIFSLNASAGHDHLAAEPERKWICCQRFSASLVSLFTLEAQRIAKFPIV